nr:hypothetical protein [Bremerella volcania]
MPHDLIALVVIVVRGNFQNREEDIEHIADRVDPGVFPRKWDLRRIPRNAKDNIFVHKVKKVIDRILLMYVQCIEIPLGKLNWIARQILPKDRFSFGLAQSVREINNRVSRDRNPSFSLADQPFAIAGSLGQISLRPSVL